MKSSRPARVQVSRGAVARGRARAHKNRSGDVPLAQLCRDIERGVDYFLSNRPGLEHAPQWSGGASRVGNDFLFGAKANSKAKRAA